MVDDQYKETTFVGLSLFLLYRNTQKEEEKERAREITKKKHLEKQRDETN